MLSPMEHWLEGNPDFEYVLAYALIESGKVVEGLPRMEKSAQATHSIDSWVIAGEARLQRREFHFALVWLGQGLHTRPVLSRLHTMVLPGLDALVDAVRGCATL